MENLKGIEIGDRVWSTLYGYGTVVEIDESANYPILVNFDRDCNVIDPVSFSRDGKSWSTHEVPSLFFDIPEMYKEENYPEKPRWRAKLEGRYYLVTSLGTVNHCQESGNLYDDALFDVGNYFKTEEEAMNSKFYKAFND